jgi:hypothetical protein
LRQTGFAKGLDIEARLLLVKCRALGSKKIDMAKEKKAREFESASKRLREIAK